MRTVTVIRLLRIISIAMPFAATPAWPQAAANSVFVAVAPCRIVDTRATAAGAIAGGSTRAFNVVGVSNYSAQGGSPAGCGIPGFAAAGLPTVNAVAMNVIAVTPSAQGNLLVYPTNVTPGISSTLNFPGPSVPLNVANGVIVQVRSDAPGNDVSVKPSQTTHLVIDVTGYFTTLPIRADLGGVTPNLIGGSSENHVALDAVSQTYPHGAVIAGGGSDSEANVVIGSSNASIGGGSRNELYASDFSSIAGGRENHVFGETSAIGGGRGHHAGVVSLFGDQHPATYSVIAGGQDDTAYGFGAAICGGSTNQAIADYATACGGLSNTVDHRLSFAAGRRSHALSNGVFVWGDSTDLDESVSVTNLFAARAWGGFKIVSGVNPETGVQVPAGSGSWSSLSDAAVKRDLREIDSRAILDRLAALPIHEWSYKSQGPGIRHVGPMAQDFRHAFGLGHDDKHIDSVDADGITLAALQRLYAMIRSERSELARDRRTLDAKERNVTKLSKELAVATARLEDLEALRMRDHAQGSAEGAE